LVHLPIHVILKNQSKSKNPRAKEQEVMSNDPADSLIEAISYAHLIKRAKTKKRTGRIGKGAAPGFTSTCQTHNKDKFTNLLD